MFDRVLFYKVGEVFMLHTTDAITSMLERAKEIASEDISKLQVNIEAHQEVLKNLKVQLYDKLGDGINLEEELSNTAVHIHTSVRGGRGGLEFGQF